MYLPSGNLLKLYKNTVDKETGVSHRMIQWMAKEFERSEESKEGGVVFDEMHIHSGLEMDRDGDGLKMFGYVDYGEGNNGIAKSLSTGGVELATTVLQFVFLSFKGFRFPFSYMSSAGLSAGHLTAIFGDIVNTLKMYDFNVHFVCMDGASINRSFINSIMTNPAISSASNLCDITQYISCVMDFSHVIKKIRNNVYASGNLDHHSRNLQHPDGMITWEMWRDAYQWDRRNNYLPIHRKLSQEHFYLTTTLKMRNHLAEEVLNQDMLYLFQHYQQSLPDPSLLDGPISLISVASLFINTYCSMQPITSVHDSRLDDLRKVLDFFNTWFEYCIEQRGPRKLEKDIFLTTETYNDIKNCIQGLLSLCQPITT